MMMMSTDNTKLLAVPSSTLEDPKVTPKKVISPKFICSFHLVIGEGNPS
jgi:hypothetical protein